jgi:hypothetical protein
VRGMCSSRVDVDGFNDPSAGSPPLILAEGLDLGHAEQSLHPVLLSTTPELSGLTLPLRDHFSRGPTISWAHSGCTTGTHCHLVCELHPDPGPRALAAVSIQ